ncbi:MAG: YitT family protein [Pelovirga sp.]
MSKRAALKIFLRDQILPLILAVIAGVLYTISLRYFVFPAKVILTGTEGIAAATAYYFDSTLMFLILYAIFQSILIVFGYIKVSRRFAIRSTLTVATVLVLLPLLPDLHFAAPEPENERMVLVLFGGILGGLAKALALWNRGSTGDEDIISAFVAERMRKPVGTVAIIAAGVSTSYGLTLEFFRTGDIALVVNTLMYTAIYIFASAETLNTFFRKFRFSLVTIITTDASKTNQILKTILPERTYTKQAGVGGYTSSSREVLSLIVTQEELPLLLRHVREQDPDSFLYHSDVNGIVGRFKVSSIG